MSETNDPTYLAHDQIIEFETNGNVFLNSLSFSERLSSRYPDILGKPTFLALHPDAQEARLAKPNDKCLVRIPRGMLSIFNAFHFLEQRCKHLEANANEVIDHIAHVYLEWKNEEDDIEKYEKLIEKVISSAYEAEVYFRLAQAGLSPNLLKRRKHRRRPDISCDALDILVECKDAQSTHGFDRSPEKIGRWVRGHIATIDDQFLAEDPNREKCWILCLDLPEGAAEFLRSDEAQTIFRQVAFGDETEPSGISKWAHRCFLTSFEHNQKTPLKVGAVTEQEHEKWIDPLYWHTHADARLLQFVKAVYSSFGDEHFVRIQESFSKAKPS